MTNTKRPIGCIGLIMVALFLGIFAFIFFRITAMDTWDVPVEGPHHPRKHFERTEESEGPDLTTMDAQLLIAQQKGQKVTQIRLEGSPMALDSPLTIKEVGYDVVVFEGAFGLMTVRLESIVAIVVGPEEPKKAAEPQVEK